MHWNGKSTHVAIATCCGTFSEAPSGSHSHGATEFTDAGCARVLMAVGRPQLEALADKTATAPVLSLVSALLKDWIPLIDEYHYCEFCSLRGHPRISRAHSSTDTAT